MRYRVYSTRVKSEGWYRTREYAITAFELQCKREGADRTCITLRASAVTVFRWRSLLAHNSLIGRNERRQVTGQKLAHGKDNLITGSPVGA